MNTKKLTAFAIFFLLGTVTAMADWGPWRPFGDTGISIRFAQVSRTMCTWSFRNDSNRTLKAFSFSIDDLNADTGQSEHSTDLIPYALRPGQAVGGWTAFSANANCGTVQITSTNIEWQ